MYIIMTDTSANLEPADLKKWEIEDLPLTYMGDGKSPRDSGDAAFDGPAFYAAMRGGAKVVTSQVTPQTYIDAMTPFLKEGKDVLFIGMSSGISGSYNSAQIAANQLREEFPACKIYTIDTLSASLGEGLLVVKAAENRRSGMSIEENAAEIDKLRHNMCQVFTVDDLKYLRGTGRLSSIKAAVASVLNIKPLLKGDTEGKIVCFEKTRGRKNAIKALAQQYDEMVREPYNQCIGIFYQLRSEVSARSINHAVGYFFDGFLNKRYLVVNNDSHNAAVLFDDFPSCEDTTNPPKWLSNARKII